MLRLDAAGSAALGVAALTPALRSTGRWAPRWRGCGRPARFLVPYAAALWRIAARRPVPRPAAATVVGLDVAWVAASGAVAAAGWSR